MDILEKIWQEKECYVSKTIDGFIKFLGISNSEEIDKVKLKDIESLPGVVKAGLENYGVRIEKDLGLFAWQWHIADTTVEAKASSCKEAALIGLAICWWMFSASIIREGEKRE